MKFFFVVFFFFKTKTLQILFN